MKEPSLSISAPEATIRSQGATLSQPARRRLPLVAIAGAAGKSTTGWLLTEILESSSRAVGAWLSSGVYLDGSIRLDELHAWELAVNAARAREIDTLIQEVPSVLAKGLPPGAIEIAVVTSICGADQACRRDEASEREREAVEQVIGSLSDSGTAIANADDLMVVESLERSNRKVIYYALNEANPVLKNHLDQGGRACWIDDGWLVFRDANGSRALASVAGIPATLGGHLSYQVQNALAAASAAMALGIEPREIEQGLARFSPEPARQPGAFGLTYLNGRTIITDRPRSVWALKLLVRSVRATAPKRILVAMGCLPELSSSEAGQAARVIGALGGVVVLHGGGGSVERLEEIKSGLASVQAPPVILTLDDEPAAIRQVLDMLHRQDTAIILADDGRLVANLLLTAP